MTLDLPLRYLALTATCLCALHVAAQTVSGSVVDADGEPLIGANVLVAGSASGTITDLDGSYSVGAGPGDTLVFSYTGYATEAVAVGDRTTIDIVLREGADLDEVVVAALGISRERKALGYAVEELNTEELVSQRQNNIVSALQGQVAGVQVSTAGGGPGQAARIIIRGVNSLDPNADNQPLFVVDGIPISNETIDAGGGAGRNVSNRAADLNPNDIETLTVLKGGAATALYGLRAANGAVIITTKRGRPGELRVNASVTAGVEEINKVPETQRVYTQGFGGVYDPNSFWPSWGPPVSAVRDTADPSHPDLFNNYENAYETGRQVQTNVSLSGGTERASFRTSFSHLDHEGVLPFSDYENTNISVDGRFSTEGGFEYGGSVRYVKSGGNRVFADRFNERLVYWAPRVDVTDYQFPDGTMRGYRFDGRGGNNPIFGEATNRFVDDVDRYLGNVTFAYTPKAVPRLSFRYVLGLDQYTDFREATAPAPRGLADEAVFENNGLGFVEETRIRSRDLTSNLTGTYGVDLGNEFDLTALAGFDVFDSRFDRVSTRGEELDIFDLFSLNNAAVITTESFERRRRLLGLYGDLSLSWRDAVYLSLTGRNDWSSTLPAANRSFFYPSVSASVVFSEFVGLTSALDYGKLRLSYAGIGKDTEPYRLAPVYVNPTGFPIDGTTGWTRGSQKGADDLLPERTNTFEIGTDLRFFGSRLRADLTYYTALSVDQIIPVPVSETTGFSTFILNAGSIRNSGFEVAVSGTLVETTDVTWDLGFNFTTNDNEVVEIRDGIEEILIGSSFGYAGSTASTRLIEGEAYGNIYGTSYARFDPDADPDNPDADLFLDRDAPLLIGEDGFPVIESTQKILGNATPNWFGALNTRFRYRGLSASLLFDTRQGVQKYNQLGNFFAAFGIAPYTLDREETVVFEGVRADGTPNTTPVWLGQGTGPDGEEYGAGYYRNRYRASTENFVEDADWIRLRSASLSYALPASLFEDKFVDAASVTLTGNNLWLSTPFTGFDPEGAAGNANTNVGFGGFTYPAVQSVLLTLDVTL